MPELEVSIAVPLRNGARPIFVTAHEPHFHVVLRNRGHAPLKLWTQSCSWGHDALRFETVDAEGKVTEIRRRPIEFLQNAPVSYELDPGDTTVFDIYFTGDDWQTFARPARRKMLSIRMRAVYQVAEDDASRKHDAWTGSVSSPLAMYRFEDRR